MSVREENEELRAQNAALEEQLARYEDVDPSLLAMAKEVQSAIIDVLDAGTDGLSTAEIGELAYKYVLDKHLAEARDEKAAEYYRDHRRELYERMIGEIAVEEGEAISASVKQKIETDPELAKQLLDAARQELFARATGLEQEKIAAEQQTIVDNEAGRLLELDRLDVKLALDGELDLTSDEVLAKLQPNDKVQLFYNRNGRRAKLELTWVRDANQKEGWALIDGANQLSDNFGHSIHIPDNRFVRIASLGIDMDTGKDVLLENKLVVGRPVVLEKGYGGRDYERYDLRYKSSEYGSSTKPVVLAGSDFQTRDLQFYSGVERK